MKLSVVFKFTDPTSNILFVVSEESDGTILLNCIFSTSRPTISLVLIRTTLLSIVTLSNDIS